MSGFLANFTADPVGFSKAVYASTLAETTVLAKNFQFDTQYRSLLTSTSSELSFNIFFSWVLLFLALYIAFALFWKFIVPSAGLSTGKLPFIASSRCIGTVHCLLVVPLSMLALAERNPNYLKFPNIFELEYLDLSSPLEQRVIELSVGYFVADFVHFVLFEPDVLMFFHHFFSIAMMSSAGLLGRAGACATAAIVQGEITNPFQSAWTVAKAAKANKLLNILSPLFTLVFVLVRIPIVPYWSYIINHSMWTSPNHSKMPYGYIPVWSVMALFMVLGGFVWSWSLIKGLRKFYAKKAQATKEDGKKKR